MKLLPGIVPEIHKPELRIIAGIYPIPNDAVESFDFAVDEFGQRNQVGGLVVWPEKVAVNNRHIDVVLHARVHSFTFGVDVV